METEVLIAMLATTFLSDRMSSPLFELTVLVNVKSLLRYDACGSGKFTLLWPANIQTVQTVAKMVAVKHTLVSTCYVVRVWSMIANEFIVRYAFDVFKCGICLYDEWLTMNSSPGS